MWIPSEASAPSALDRIGERLDAGRINTVVVRDQNLHGLSPYFEFELVKTVLLRETPVIIFTPLTRRGARTDPLLTPYSWGLLRRPPARLPSSDHHLTPTQRTDGNAYKHLGCFHSGIRVVSPLSVVSLKIGKNNCKPGETYRKAPSICKIPTL